MRKHITPNGSYLQSAHNQVESKIPAPSLA